jgi:hypothetical protein
MDPTQRIRVLVTGATGFLGGNIVAALAANPAVDCVAACRSARRLPLIADSDLGHAFERAAVAQGPADYESFNICGAEFPTLREVLSHIAKRADLPVPLYRVLYPVGYAFGWLMEALKPVLPGSSPFLTRSIVDLCEDWLCRGDYARQKLGYLAGKAWRDAVDEHPADLKLDGYPWPRLCQP